MLWTSSYQPASTRRERRSLSSVVNPYTTSVQALVAPRGCTHQRSSSAAVLDLDYGSLKCDARSKRRSLSHACSSGGGLGGGVGTADNNNSVSPTPHQQQAKAAKNLDEDFAPISTCAVTASPLTSTTVSRSRSSKLSSSGSAASKISVRFNESTGGSLVTGPTTAGATLSTATTPTTASVAKCHHLLSDDEPKQPLQQQQQFPPPVQRTHSNPEMELCSVCLARKECEILLKRTYSKVKTRDPPNRMSNLFCFK